MSLSPTRRRADRFAELLDRRGRTDDPGLGPLVTLASALQAVPLGPRPEFRDTLRQRLVAVAAVQAAEPARTPSAGERLREWGQSWRGQRRLAAAAGGLAAVTMIGGVGVAAERSLPGDTFYALKSATERVQLATTTGDLDRGELHLDFARARLKEVDALSSRTAALPGAGEGRPVAAGFAVGGSTAERIVDTLAAMDRETEAGTKDLARAWRSSGTPRAVTALDAFAVRQRHDLAEVRAALPPAAQQRAAVSLALLQNVETLVDRMRAECADGCGATPTPRPRTTACCPGPTPTPTATPTGGGLLGPGGLLPILPGGSQSPAPGGTPTPTSTSTSGSGPNMTTSPLPLPLPLPSLSTSSTLPGVPTIPALPSDLLGLDLGQ